MNKLEIREWLISEAEEKYQKFASSLLPNVDNVLGVRLPKLRKKAKELAKICVVENVRTKIRDKRERAESDARSANSFSASRARQERERIFESGVLDSEATGRLALSKTSRLRRTALDMFDYNFDYFEEVLLLGMIIGELKLPFESHLELVRKYVPLINNWSVCDSFCVGLKFVEKDKVRVWEFLQTYLDSDNEFELRFGVVVLLNYFVTDEWVNAVLDKLFTLNSDKYYAQMGIAWAISVCLMKYFDKTYEKLSEVQFSPVIFKKCIQKGCESYRLTHKQKLLLKALV